MPGGVREQAAAGGGEEATVEGAVRVTGAEDGGGDYRRRRGEAGQRVARTGEAALLLLRVRRQPAFRAGAACGGAFSRVHPLLEDVGEELLAAAVPGGLAVRDRPLRAPDGAGPRRRRRLPGDVRRVLAVAHQGLLDRAAGGVGAAGAVPLLRSPRLEHDLRPARPAQRCPAAGLARRLPRVLRLPSRPSSWLLLVSALVIRRRRRRGRRRRRRCGGGRGDERWRALFLFHDMIRLR